MKTGSVHTFCLSVLFAFFVACSSAYAEQLLIPGSGACEVILQELAQVFNAENPGAEVIILPSVGSTRGIKFVLAGEYDLGRVARPLTDTELDYGLLQLKFARDVLVFAVGPKTGIDNLSSQQLTDVYAGRVTNWKDVGGHDSPVRLLTRNPDDSSYKLIAQKFDAFRSLDISSSAKVMYHDYEMVNALNKYSSAIGWVTSSTLKSIDPSVKPIAINNIAPSLQNVIDGSYSMVVEFGFIYKKGKLEGLARRFVEFVTSKQGSRILTNAGLIPLNVAQ